MLQINKNSPIIFPKNMRKVSGKYEENKFPQFGKILQIPQKRNITITLRNATYPQYTQTYQQLIHNLSTPNQLSLLKFTGEKDAKKKIPPHPQSVKYLACIKCIT